MSVPGFKKASLDAGFYLSTYRKGWGPWRLYRESRAQGFEGACAVLASWRRRRGVAEASQVMAVGGF